MRYRKRGMSAAEKAEYAIWCKKYNIDPKTSKSLSEKISTKKILIANPDARYRRPDGNKMYRSVDSRVTEGAANRSIMNPQNWKNESPETIEQIVAKSKRIAPHFSKGADQYVTEGLDKSDLGRKK